MIDLSEIRPLGPAPAHYDLDAVIAGLRATAASWVPQHFPNGRREGGEWRLADISGRAPRKQGSCVIALEGERAGDWIDFDDNQGGGPLSTLEHATGLTGRALIEYAASSQARRRSTVPATRSPRACRRSSGPRAPPARSTSFWGGRRRSRALQARPISPVAGCAFLGNLSDMYEAADAEGGVWRGFVAQWWERFGTAEVGVADLYELALESELPLAKGDERAKRTSLGQTLKRMRDRVYTVGTARVHVCHAGAVQGAQRWRLEMEDTFRRGSRGSQGSRVVREPLACEGGGSREVHGESTLENQCGSEPREPGEPFSPPYIHAHARVLEKPGKGSRGSRGSQSSGKLRPPACEPPCEPPDRGSQRPDGWWEEVL